MQQHQWDADGVYITMATAAHPNAAMIIESGRIGLYDLDNGWTAIWEHRW